MNHSIEISDLTFSYSNKRSVLSIEYFKMDEHERLFLYGPSGHGKSTLLNIIAGVLNANALTLNILGLNYLTCAQNKKDHFRGENIGYIFQNFNLIPYLTILENILLPCIINLKRSTGHDLEQAKELIEVLGLTRYMNRKVTDLSVGQQQRVAAARSLMGHPKLLIADEPTSSLDDKHAGDFLDLLLRECERRKFALLFVSHNQTLKSHFKSSLSLVEINHVMGVDND